MSLFEATKTCYFWDFLFLFVSSAINLFILEELQGSRGVQKSQVEFPFLNGSPCLHKEATNEIALKQKAVYGVRYSCGGGGRR